MATLPDADGIRSCHVKLHVVSGLAQAGELSVLAANSLQAALG